MGTANYLPPCNIMATSQTDDVRIKQIRPLIPPALLLEDFPLSGAAQDTVLAGRKGAEAIVRGDDGRLEGSDQRPSTERLLCDQQGSPPRPRPAPRARRERLAYRSRIPRRHLAPVHRRPRLMGRDWGTHDRVTGSQRARKWSLDPGRIQEWHRRKRRYRYRRHKGRVLRSRLPFRHEAGSERHR